MSSSADDHAPASLTPGNQAPEPSSDASDTFEKPTGGLATRSFWALLVTQFLVALNDNMFRWLIVPIGKDLIGDKKALALGAVAFLVPFLLLAGPAGFAADRFSKRSVMIVCKVAEILIMAVGIGAILTGNAWLMLTVLFLMGAQSAFFSPAKYGAIPEIVREDRISAANGLIGMTTMVAVILGVAAGGFLYTWTTIETAAGVAVNPGQHHLWISAAALIGVAMIGWFASLLIGRLKPAVPDRTVPVNPFSQTLEDLRELFTRRALLLASVASAFYWSAGALFQLNVDQLATESLQTDQTQVGYLLALLTLGIGLGAFLAGIWSKGKVQPGIVPIGCLGMMIGAVLLFTVPNVADPTEVVAEWLPFTAPYIWAGICLLGLGVAGGLYDIPLLAFLQEKSPRECRGRILAANNFLAFSGMLAASGLYWFLSADRADEHGLDDLALSLSPQWIFLIMAVPTLVVAIIAYLTVPAATTRLILKPLARLIYRIRIEGLENLPTDRGALVVANHVSWIDGVLMMLFCPRPIRMVAYADYVTTGLGGRISRAERVIPIGPGRKSVVEAIRAVREALTEGALVGIFPEGGLSRNRLIQPFQPGFLSMLKGTDAVVVPLHLGGLWGSIFSFERGKFFWKWPLRIPYPISIRFGEPIEHVTDGQQVRRILQEMEGESMATEEQDIQIPARGFLRMCRRNRRRSKVADSTGIDLTGGELLTRTLVLRRVLRREVLADDELNVGVLLPPSVGGVVTNVALSVDRRVAVNLNYTVTSEIMNHCIREAGIKHVLTSRKVMEKFNFDIDAELVYLEDIKEKVALGDKLTGALQSRLMPLGMLERRLGLDEVDPDDLLTLIFTSGSTGMPKGVMLSHRNVASNINAFRHVLHLDCRDVLVGILPLFHSFGYTVTMWTVLDLDPKGAYHFSPLEPRQVSKLCAKHHGTILLATPTFLRSYTRRCQPEDFDTLEVVVTSAERLAKEDADAFEARFGIRPVEAYGATELSPGASLNIPSNRNMGATILVAKEGSVGLPLPGVVAKVVDPDTGEELDTGTSGMLLIKGANVMQGYHGRQDLTDEVIQDGWYRTGDIAKIDEHGFIHITGRQSRFSKIGGEMVPHLRIEEAISEILGSTDEKEGITLVVIGVPDARKGERLIVLHTGLSRPADEICHALAEAGLPSLWIPSRNDFHEVSEIPVLGTGKLDLQAVAQLAKEKAQ